MERLPSDLVSLLAQFIPLSDLKNFRLCSRWAEHESLKVFARRVFHETKLIATAEGVGHLRRVLQTKGFGTAVRKLQVNFVEGFGAILSDLKADDVEARRGRVEVVDVLELMPRLESLSLGKFNSRTLRWQMPLDVVREKAVLGNVTSLTITDAALTSAEILDLVDLPGKKLKWVDISQTIALNGDWLTVIRALRGMGLERLAIGNLEMYKEKNQLLLLEESRRAHKAFRGKMGIEHYALTQDGGRMLGSQAVEGGLVLILEYLEGNPPVVRDQFGLARGVGST
ncbi:hypothetical protein Tdes44962_MAKER01052 [Teratosphaeria destructans]|uniref:F-box domain-containing protein n=1 Tax=Teratosphaeria destructans TaxID=418781 RepID=A0A9W7VXU7_9PEZI|nr:hypothetical protein Tdes44962_MAKER01052 [Teratosphaeria destructans]